MTCLLETRGDEDVEREAGKKGAISGIFQRAAHRTRPSTIV